MSGVSSKPRNSVIGARFTVEEFEALQERAKSLGSKNLSRWARNVLLDELKPRKTKWKREELAPAVELYPQPQPGVTIVNGEPEQYKVAPEPPMPIGVRVTDDGYVASPIRTWAEEWAAMQQMEPVEAVARLKELCKGVPFPQGWGKWTQQERMVWLERNVPL